jgi:hypothetical protein
VIGGADQSEIAPERADHRSLLDGVELTHRVVESLSDVL